MHSENQRLGQAVDKKVLFKIVRTKLEDSGSAYWPCYLFLLFPQIVWDEC